MDLSKLVDWIKLSPKYLLPISLVCGFLLFTGEVFLEKFGLKEFVDNSRPWIGIIFLMATSLVVVDVFYRIANWLKLNYTRIKKQKSRLDRLLNLTPEEKDIFLGYLVPNTRTQFFPINDGVVTGLEAEGLIFKSSNVGNLDSWPFNIQPLTWAMLKEHSKEIFSTDEISSYHDSNESASERSQGRARHW